LGSLNEGSLVVKSQSISARTDQFTGGTEWLSHPGHFTTAVQWVLSKGCQEKDSASAGGEMVSRDPAHDH